jgi:hypothetical protein
MADTPVQVRTDLPDPHPAAAPHPPKKKQLELQWHSLGKFYKITRITNSSWAVPGEPLSRDMVKLINDSGKYPDWEITAVDYDYFAAVAALVGGAAGMVASKAMLPIP